MLLNVTIFMWYGAVCPWHQFLANDVVPLYRLVSLGILVLLLRRLPWVFALHRRIPQIEQVRQAIFVGFFGPIGVSAIFYLYITNEFLATLTGANGEIRSDVAKLPEAVTVVVWFLCICSVVSAAACRLSFPDLVVSPKPKRFLAARPIAMACMKSSSMCSQVQVVHGLSIPLGKLGYYLPRTISRSITEDPDTGATAPFHIGSRVNSFARRLPTISSSRRASEERSRVASPAASRATSVRPVWRIGGSVIREQQEAQREAAREGGQRPHGTGGGEGSGSSTPPVLGPAGRTIRFPDEAGAHDASGGRAGNEDAALASPGLAAAS